MLSLLSLFEDVEPQDYLLILDYNLGFSIAVSLISTLLSLLIGSLIAHELTLRKGHNPFISKIFEFVMVFPHIAFAYITYLFFAPEGFLGRIFETDLSLVNDNYGLGIIVNYVLKEVPFVSLLLLSQQGIKDRRYLQIAQSLGANRFESFFKVFLPQKRSALITCAIIIFAFVLGNFEVPAMLGSNSTQFTSVLSLELFQSIDDEDNRISKVLIASIFFISLSFSLILKGLFTKKEESYE